MARGKADRAQFTTESVIDRDSRQRQRSRESRSVSAITVDPSLREPERCDERFAAVPAGLLGSPGRRSMGRPGPRSEIPPEASFLADEVRRLAH